MRKIIMHILIVLSVAIISVAIILLSDPLRWSEKSIRTKMLKLTPVGTSMDEVISVVQNNNWKYHKREYGYYYRHGWPSRHKPETNDHAVGVKSMDVYIGEYSTIFDTGVSVFYAFDEDSKLVDIAVLKETDSL